jgi:hypothetical protein
MFLRFDYGLIGFFLDKQFLFCNNFKKDQIKIIDFKRDKNSKNCLIILIIVKMIILKIQLIIPKVNIVI